MALLCLAMGQASAKRVEHWVVRGDTAYNLAKRYGLSLEALLAQANLGTGGLKLGQKLVLDVPDDVAAPPPASSAAPVSVAGGLGAVAGPAPAPAVALGPSVPLPRPGAAPVAQADVPPSLPAATTPPGPADPFTAARLGIDAGSALALGTTPPGAARPPASPQAAVPVPPDPPVTGPVPLSPAPTTGGPTYTVVTGDTAYSVARRFGLSLPALLALNTLGTPDLRAGQVLVVGPGAAVATPAAPDGATLRVRALALLGTPYVYGGSSPAGTDCSGFIVQVYTPLGVTLPRRSADQAGAGTPVAPTDLREGDLLFFDTTGRGEVTHVGIYLDGQNFINANSYLGRVVIDRLNDPYFAGRFLGARRVLPAVAAQPASTTINGTSANSGSR